MNDFFYKNYFKPKIYKILNQKIKYYSIGDNYKLDEYCELFYDKFKRNPYFVNKWYSMDVFHSYLIDELKNNYSEKKIILELGAGLGITAALLKKNEINVFAADYEFTSCLLIKAAAKLNKFDLETINCDWTNPPFKKTFDAIIGIDIIYEKETAQHIFNCLNHSLKKDGIVYLANFENYAFQLLIDLLNKKYNQVYSKEVKKLNQKIQIYKFEFRN